MILCEIIKHIPLGRLTKQKMMTINEIIHSKLFLYPECRKIMLPLFMKQVKTLFEVHEEVSDFNYDILLARVAFYAQNSN